jgi:hypothetical protein
MRGYDDNTERSTLFPSGWRRQEKLDRDTERRTAEAEEFCAKREWFKWRRDTAIFLAVLLVVVWATGFSWAAAAGAFIGSAVWRAIEINLKERRVKSAKPDADD